MRPVTGRPRNLTVTNDESLKATSMYERERSRWILLPGEARVLAFTGLGEEFTRSDDEGLEIKSLRRGEECVGYRLGGETT